MNSNIFNGEEIEKYNTANVTVMQCIEIIEQIIEKNPIAGGYIVRHSKFKGVSYDSDDEYVDQFITLYVPPKNNNSVKKDAMYVANNNHIESLSKEISEENIHEFSFDAKYSMDANNKILYMHDPGTGNRTNLNAILNMLNKVIPENNNYSAYNIQYRNDTRGCKINEICVNFVKKSIKFY